MEKLTREEIDKGLDEAYKNAGHNAYYGNGFHAGIEFALNNLKETKKPFLIKNSKIFRIIKNILKVTSFREFSL